MALILIVAKNASWRKNQKRKTNNLYKETQKQCSDPIQAPKQPMYSPKIAHEQPQNGRKGNAQKMKELILNIETHKQFSDLTPPPKQPSQPRRPKVNLKFLFDIEKMLVREVLCDFKVKTHDRSILKKVKLHIYINCGTKKQVKQVLLGQKEVTARIRGTLRRDGPNDFMFVYDLIQKDLSISILFVFIFLFCQSCFLFFAI